MRNSSIPAKTAQEVEAEAMERVRSEGGSPDGDSTALVLSRHTLQFGQYRGQTFKWLLENDLQYAAYIITGHESEGPPRRRQTPDPLMDNKVLFLSHVCYSHWLYWTLTTFRPPVQLIEH